MDLKDVANQHVPEVIGINAKEKDIPIEKHDYPIDNNHGHWPDTVMLTCLIPPHLG